MNTEQAIPRPAVAQPGALLNALLNPLLNCIQQRVALAPAPPRASGQSPGPDFPPPTRQTTGGVWEVRTSLLGCKSGERGPGQQQQPATALRTRHRRDPRTTTATAKATSDAPESRGEASAPGHVRAVFAAFGGNRESHAAAFRRGGGVR
jgi:hypothetical protein